MQELLVWCFGVGYVVMVVLCFVMNISWSKLFDKNSNDWYELCSKYNKEWYDDCTEIIKRHQELYNETNLTATMIVDRNKALVAENEELKTEIDRLKGYLL